jgi:hypothetical protein
MKLLMLLCKKKATERLSEALPWTARLMSISLNILHRYIPCFVVASYILRSLDSDIIIYIHNTTPP